MKLYDFTARKMKGKEVSMEEYKDKVLLIVNTASKCGLTPQLEGLEVLGFPCNQFASQDPGTNKEISEFCLLKYGVTFTIFEKIDVNGEDTHPIYKFLKKEILNIKYSSE